MWKDVKDDLLAAENAHKYINEHIPPILLADLEAIVLLILRILIAMLKRELKGLK